MSMTTQSAVTACASCNAAVRWAPTHLGVDLCFTAQPVNAVHAAQAGWVYQEHRMAPIVELGHKQRRNLHHAYVLHRCPSLPAAA